MTKQQLRALSKKHLLVLVLDLQNELQQALSEKEQLMLDKEQLVRAYQCGFQYAQQQWPVWQQQYPMQQVQPQDIWQQQTYLWS